LQKSAFRCGGLVCWLFMGLHFCSSHIDTLVKWEPEARQWFSEAGWSSKL